MGSGFGVMLAGGEAGGPGGPSGLGCKTWAPSSVKAGPLSPPGGCIPKPSLSLIIFITLCFSQYFRNQLDYSVVWFSVYII